MKVYITFVKWIKGDTVSLMDPNATACVQFIYSSLNHSFPLFLHFKMRCFFSLEIQMQINDVHLSSFWKKKKTFFLSVKNPEEVDLYFQMKEFGLHFLTFKCQ